MTWNFRRGLRCSGWRFPRPRKIAALRKRAWRAGIPVVYVNDNFGRWQSDFRSQVEHCRGADIRGREIAALLTPGPNDYFVLKPKHSGFFSTTLDILLDYLRAETLILGGFAGNLCVLYTANDAHMRDYHLIVPRDCIASESKALNDTALEHMSRYLNADTRLSRSIRFPAKKK